LGKCAEGERAVGLGTKAGYAMSADWKTLCAGWRTGEKVGDQLQNDSDVAALLTGMCSIGRRPVGRVNNYDLPISHIMSTKALRFHQ
jgi:hypothetical protein